MLLDVASSRSVDCGNERIRLTLGRPWQHFPSFQLGRAIGGHGGDQKHAHRRHTPPH
jgi:hypothetical protein